MADDEKRIPLSQVLQKISLEMREADSKAREGGKAVMRFAECELEFAIELEAKGKAGVEVWIARLGGSIKRTEANTLRIKYVALDGAEKPDSVVAEIKGSDDTHSDPIVRSGKPIVTEDDEKGVKPRKRKSN
ncbi:trypco2 family protein [Paraburkholderia tropica]|uniref:trypco2 family protein n=1 Tax=Paraburkholderia tropica TaxID=92647 RepID=UPI002AB76A1B|nr:trypco2 family protein [Paraburkholderia tropica]